jgi:diguanylate cyclase (GGDEF)-like protein
MMERWWARVFRRRLSVDEATVRRAFVDPLTQLPTRFVMMDRLRAAREARVAGALAMCDLDHFKQVNDRFGHAAGDEILVAAARRLERLLPTDAWVARAGGDEFVLFMPRMPSSETAQWLDRCLEEFRRPIDVTGHGPVVVTLSAGVATFGDGSIDAALHAADAAMYAAKARGRDRFVAFDDDTRKIVTARRELASAVAELQARNRALRDEARTDALTGLRNRLALDELLDAQESEADTRLAAAAAAVAFVDIDHFGAYNKLHGDAGGDEALRRVATAVRGVSRHPDLAFRKGGEELVVVVPEVTSEHALVVAERIRGAVEALGIPHSGSTTAPVLTVTVGIATGHAGVPLRRLLVAASDQAMQAKVDRERNRVHGVDVA